jgi:hypothetical protein
MIGGDLCYGRADWVGQVLGGRADPLEPVLAWGKEMLLETGYTGMGGPTPGPNLAQLRAELISQYPALGRIFA